MFGGGIGMQEILIILIVGLLVFGAARLPKIARSLGLGIKEFKKTIKGIEGEDNEEGNKIKYVQNQPTVNQQQYPPNNPNMRTPGQGQYNSPDQPYQQNMGGGSGQPAGQPPNTGDKVNQEPEQNNPAQPDDEKQGT